MRPADLLPLLRDHLPAHGPVHTADEAVAAALAAETTAVDLDAVAPGTLAAVLLLGEELWWAGIRAPVVLAAAIQACRPGGVVAVRATSAMPLLARGQVPEGRTYTAHDLAHTLGERGTAVELLCAPGAAARLAGRRWAGPADLPMDRTPGLLDAGTHLLAVATTPTSPVQRSRRFFASIDRKVVAAGVVCQDRRGRLLLVHDRFKGHWTIPGGLVDAGEDPASAAVREAEEEAGTVVELRDLLGVFAADHPDRLLLVYGAVPEPAVTDPRPVHTHEISAVRWATPAQAATLLPDEVRRRVRRCLEEPGRTWRE